jgi:hypothetical protein
MTTNTRINSHDETEYLDVDGYWLSERDVCRHCQEEREAAGKPFRYAEERTSFGCYAGRYCDHCWPLSGFRDATDDEATFDPADAGERIEADY